MKKYETFTEELKRFIKDLYLEEYSVSIVLKQVKEKYPNMSPIGRTPITDYLKHIGVYEGLTGSNYVKKNNERVVNTIRERYGVDNWGQTADGGWTKLNSIKYEKLNIDKEFSEFKRKVEKLTRKNVKKLNELPIKCEYTGVTFNDIYGDVNPNDPLKRTIDHIVPVIHAFIMGWTVEETSDITNIAFVIRIVNSIKGNTSKESFNSLLPNIKERLINEGLICK